MKKLLLFALVLLLFTACKKNADSTYRVIDPVFKNDYLADAQQILFRLLQDGSVTTDKNKPEFNGNELDKILTSLQAIHNLGTRQTDSIFNISKVHIYKHVSLNGIILQVNQNPEEGKKLLLHQASGNATFDALMTKYKFTFYGDLTRPNYGFASIISTEAYNITPLIAAFKNYNFIVNAQQDGYVGDGNDIGYTLTAYNGVDIDFAIKTGDCPAGCGVRHGWRYHVDFNNNFKVKYNGSY